MEEQGTRIGSPPDNEGLGAGAEGSGKLGKAKEFVSDKWSSTSETVRDKYSQVRGRVGDTYSQVKNKVEDIDYAGMTDQVRTYVRSNPGKALLISVGAGFLLGLLLRRTRDDDY